MRSKGLEMLAGGETSAASYTFTYPLDSFVCHTNTYRCLLHALRGLLELVSQLYPIDLQLLRLVLQASSKVSARAPSASQATISLFIPSFHLFSLKLRAQRREFFD